MILISFWVDFDKFILTIWLDCLIEELNSKVSQLSTEKEGLEYLLKDALLRIHMAEIKGGITQGMQEHRVDANNNCMVGYLEHNNQGLVQP